MMIPAMRRSSALFDLGLTSEKLAESHQLDHEPLRIQTIHTPRILVDCVRRQRDRAMTKGSRSS
jgi:hypothetical protein